MKAICQFLMILFFFCSPQLSAQNQSNSNGGGIGVRAGVHVSQLQDGGDELFSGNHSGFFVGLFRESNLAPFLKFSSGLEYYQNGSQEGGNQVELGYASIPLSLTAKIGPLYLLGGVSGALRIRTDNDFALPDFKGGSGDYNRFDATTFLGGGVNILFLVLDIRYHWGQVDVTEGFRSRFVQVGARIKF